MCVNHPNEVGSSIGIDTVVSSMSNDHNLRLIGLLEAFALIESLELPNHYYQGQMATPGKVKNFVRNALAEKINAIRPYPAIPL